MNLNNVVLTMAVLHMAMGADVQRHGGRTAASLC